jgi:adenosylmethionine-8-amino-7-oxononanoate aminotransferase
LASLTQHKKTAALLLPLKGEGALLWDENDKEYIDAIASVGESLWA